VVQADVYHAPFAAESFDFAFSLGVLHHLPDPEAGFQAMVKLVKPGGLVWAWVYGLEGMRWWYRVSHLRWLRPITTRLPIWGQLAMTASLTGVLEVCLWTPYRLAAHIPNGQALVKRLPLSALRSYSFRGKVTSMFDRLNPPITHYHTEAELHGWCDRAKLTQVQVVNRDGRGWVISGIRPRKVTDPDIDS
jgi:SAM-dependent methyltransferase